MELSIIIVNYNVKYFLEQCLYSVIKACENIRAEIFVVDNNSTDGSREYLAPKFPNVIFKWNEQNTGFAKANNSVLNETKAPHVLFLNPDTILAEDSLEKCLAFFKLRERCGALGVRMIDGSGNFLRESKRSFPSPLASLYKMAGLAKMFPSSKIFSTYYAGHLPEDKINEVDVLAGAFFMVSKDALNETRGFDEDFFMYAEDIDLSYRIQKAGFKNYYFPETTIVHFKGESTQKKTKLYIRRFYGAMQLFVQKHYKKQKTTLVLMTVAITLSKFISFIPLFFSTALTRTKRITAANRETLVVAPQDYFNEMIQLIKYAKNPLVVQGRVSVTNDDKEAAIGFISELEVLVKKNNTATIIFCEEPLLFKNMIKIMEALKEKTGFLFHAKGSDCIVGSDRKNAKGEFIAR